jgi:hypothetical protein
MKLRTQLLLEPRHDALLRREARARKCSISAALRSVLDERIGAAALPGQGPLDALAGAANGPRGSGGREAEDLLYGPEA